MRRIMKLICAPHGPAMAGRGISLFSFFRSPVPCFAKASQGSPFAFILRSASGGQGIRRRRIKLPIVGQKTIAEKTNEISFGLSGEEFVYEAGQYVQVGLPKLLYPDHKGDSRTLSIASSPNEREKITIAFRDSGSGFKRTLMELPLGTFVDIDGPFGFFTLPRNEAQPVVFLAGGIGITPCLSMIRFADETKRSGLITLLYANRNKESAAYLDELEVITGRNPKFVLKNKFGRLDTEFIPLEIIPRHLRQGLPLGNTPHGNFNTSRGFLTGFIQNLIADMNQPIWYVVGPPPMVASMRDLLFRLNIDEGKIRFEEFTGYE